MTTNPEGLVFRPEPTSCLDQFACRLHAVTYGFLDDDTVNAGGAVNVVPKIIDDDGKEGGWEG